MRELILGLWIISTILCAIFVSILRERLDKIIELLKDYLNLRVGQKDEKKI